MVHQNSGVIVIMINSCHVLGRVLDSRSNKGDQIEEIIAGLEIMDYPDSCIHLIVLC